MDFLNESQLIATFSLNKDITFGQMFRTLVVKSSISVISVKQSFLVLFIFDWSSYFKARPVRALAIRRSLSRYVAGKIYVEASYLIFRAARCH